MMTDQEFKKLREEVLCRYQKYMEDGLNEDELFFKAVDKSQFASYQDTAIKALTVVVNHHNKGAIERLDKVSQLEIDADHYIYLLGCHKIFQKINDNAKVHNIAHMNEIKRLKNKITYKYKPIRREYELTKKNNKYKKRFFILNASGILLIASLIIIFWVIGI